MRISPCYSCTKTKGYNDDVKRAVGCHSSCKYYKDWKKVNDRVRENSRIYNYNSYDDYVRRRRLESKITVMRSDKK